MMAPTTAQQSRQPPRTMRYAIVFVLSIIRVTFFQLIKFPG